ncbi:hypothetical protein E1B28_003896 [Marasmius oreades]|uniref:Uncharacterized protein n=1 Tax=Marasmius oreades TaxID=181124 RepID=A0A9P8AC83_9AGAR|nr:uncharacterized protein E1B28_003896 [Marasmius oreades]KAG7096463.1 hypothetical protein E1B28_003896 [Marasmius oreades]
MFTRVLIILSTSHLVNKNNMIYAAVSVGGLMLIAELTWVLWGAVSLQRTRSYEQSVDGKTEYGLKYTEFMNGIEVDEGY